jgi:hypothetical protein
MNYNEYRNLLLVIPVGTTTEQYRSILLQKISELKFQMQHAGDIEIILVVFAGTGKARWCRITKNWSKFKFS